VKPRYRLEIPPHVGNAIRHLPPEVKQTVKEAMRLLASDPDAGEPLRRDLEGLWKYRARRFRIVYAIHRAGRVVQQGTLRELMQTPADPFVTQFINAQRSPLDSLKGGAM